MKILVTGGLGFIGSNFARSLSNVYDLTILDGLTYAANPANAPEGAELFIGRIEDPVQVRAAMAGADVVINFAAETHVDRSITDQAPFVSSNYLGTSVLLDAARELKVKRFVQISTDEVYGSISTGSFTECSPLQPSSPYSASKAAADLLVLSHVKTHGLDASIIRASNNYGPRQHPEKLIPLTITRAMRGEPIPIYGDGSQVRNWLHVTDFCRAIIAVLFQGQPGEIYNAGGSSEIGNLELVQQLLDLVGAGHELIEFVPDRLGHDQRYSLNSDKLREKTSWEPHTDLTTGLTETVAWYLQRIMEADRV